MLDSEALSSVASPGERGVARRRASAILTLALASGSRVVVPAPVLAEAGRSRSRASAIDAVIAKLAVIPTDRRIAQRAGLLLGRLGRGSEAAVDAFVAATAADHRPAVVITGDPGDLGRLCTHLPGVHVQPLSN
ncbi:MAG: type II toxin-antitoxin system VapC family toxin [Acidimicrobiia bacterium]